MAGAVIDIAERVMLLRVPFKHRFWFSALKGLPRSAWGTAFAHFGLGVTLLGIIGRDPVGRRAHRRAETRPDVSIRRYDLTFDGISRARAPIPRAVARFTVRADGGVIGGDEPSKRTFPPRGRYTTTEAALMTRGFGPALSLARRSAADGSIAVRLYHKPLVLLIWLGAVVMVFGGALSLSDRRLRVGAPKPARQSRDAAGGVSGARRLAMIRRRLRSSLAARPPRGAARRDPPDPALEARARALSQELRCMVCQNQSIDDFDAPLARDCACWCASGYGRRQRPQVLDFLVARYGEFVLLKPRFAGTPRCLWLAPAGVCWPAPAASGSAPAAARKAPTRPTGSRRPHAAERGRLAELSAMARVPQAAFQSH